MKKTALFRKILVAATAAFSIAFPAFADYNSYGIQDSAEIRKTLVDSWFHAPVSALRNKNPELINNAVGNIFQVRAEEHFNNVLIIVAPQAEQLVDFVNGSERTTLKMFTYPEGAQGSWVLSRNKSDGKPEYIRWYFNPDSQVYIQFRPDQIKTYADLVVYGQYAAKSVPVGIPFEQLYTASFTDVQNWTKKQIPWQKVTLTSALYHPTLQMVGIIRKNLPLIDYAEDACYNEDNELFSIMNNKPFELDEDYELNPERLTLSGAGFVKWICDGIVEPFEGKRTKISELTKQTVNFNPTGKAGVLYQAYNLSFSLDWCRNLAVECFAARNHRKVTLATSGVDVTLNHFAGTAGYFKDTGYSPDLLKALMYVQAVTEPSWFYLAAIKQHSVIKQEEYVFNDCAVLFPYFDDNGKFDCIVFEKGVEMSLDDFISFHENSFIHLERIKATDDFYPR